MVRVDFYGDNLAAVERDGRVFVALRPMCEAIGVSQQGQLTKLKAKGWAVIKEIFTTGADGKAYGMACLELDSVPMWLATIEPNKVGEHVRGKLVRYQLECARVLRDHFMGHRAEVVATASTPVSLDIATGARVAQNPLQRSELADEVQMVARALGVTKATVHGYLRRAFSVSGIYYLPVIVFGEAMRLLRELGTGRVALRAQRKPKLHLLKGGDSRQVDLFGGRK